MQQMSILSIQKILNDKERLSNELEKKMQKLSEWSKALDKKEALTELERQKLDEEKKKVVSSPVLSIIHKKQSVCEYVKIYKFS